MTGEFRGREQPGGRAISGRLAKPFGWKKLISCGPTTTHALLAHAKIRAPDRACSPANQAGGPWHPPRNHAGGPWRAVEQSSAEQHAWVDRWAAAKCCALWSE